MTTELGSGNSADRQAIAARCRQIIDSHQHREVLKEADIRGWIADVVGRFGDMAIWHAVRAGGFGGSEIGVLVKNHAGVRGDHMQSAHDIIEGKLLRRVPDEETSVLARGHDNESRHAEFFWKKYGCQRDQAAFSALSNAQGKHPWMRYSPDEVVLLPASQPNPALGGQKLQRWLADYKAPTTVDQSEKVSFQYVCQLHQGAILCAEQGIHLDNLVLSQFDWANWGLKDDQIVYDPELSQQIVVAGDHYWDMVLRAEVPRYVVRPRFDGEQALREAFGEKAQRLAQMLATQKALAEQTDALKAELREALKDQRMAGTRLALGELNISAAVSVDDDKVAEVVPEENFEATYASLRKKGSAATYDSKAMAAKLRELGIALKPFAQLDFDGDKAFGWLLDNGYDPEKFMTESLRMAPAEQLVEQARDLIKHTFLAQQQEPAVDEAQAVSNHMTEAASAASSHQFAALPAAALSSGDDGDPDDREGLDSRERMAPRPVAM